VRDGNVVRGQAAKLGANDAKEGDDLLCGHRLGRGEPAHAAAVEAALFLLRRRLTSVYAAAMPHKPTAPPSSRADRAAERADFKRWLANAVAELQRKHNINPAIISVRVWRHLYIQGRSPHDAADQAVSAYNRQSAADLLRKR
jgi:hypothetical protein